MAIVRPSTVGPHCPLPCSSADTLRLRTQYQLDAPSNSGAWSAEVLAHVFHRAEHGALRAHARAERLAECLTAGSADLRAVRLPWLPPPAPLSVLKRRLAKAGSPGVAEGERHARLRLGAYALAAAMGEAGDKVLLEAPTPSACRPDVTLVRRDGTRMLGVECGAVSSNTLADHLEDGGLAAVLVLPFSMLDEPADALHGWLLARPDSFVAPLPNAGAMLAAYAALIGPDGP